jgi:hypothetical protein
MRTGARDTASAKVVGPAILILPLFHSALERCPAFVEGTIPGKDLFLREEDYGYNRAMTQDMREGSAVPDFCHVWRS